ncbi:MAG: ubiquitin-like domain-containing protein [Mycobacteriales bacterium]
MLRSAKYGLYGAVLAGLVGGSALWHHVDKSVTLYVDGHRSSIHTTAASVSELLQQAGYATGPHDLLAPAASAGVHDGSTVVLKRGRLLHLTVDGVGQDVWTTAPTVAAALDQLGFSTANFTSVSRSKRLPLGPTAIALRTPKLVTVHHDGTAQQVTTTDATVGQLFAQLGITLSATDLVSQRMDTPLVDGMRIDVDRVVNTTTYEMRTIKYQTVHKPDASLPAGTMKVATHGKDGQIRTTYALVYVNGKLTGKTELSSDTVTRPVTQVEQVGTGSQPTTPAAGSSSSSSSNISVSPGSAQAIAKAMLEARGWGNDQFSCLVTMWNHESGWRVNASNGGSGAYGIPQALPGSKMASAGPDWQTNPTTQIKWGLGYISSRYGTPCGAWAQWQANGGWYY